MPRLPESAAFRSAPRRACGRHLRAALGLATSALLTLGSTAGTAQDGETPAEFVAFSVPCLNLRPGPSLEDAPVRCLPPGRRMTLLESRGEWGRVRLPDDQIGWVALELLKPAAAGTPGAVPAAPKSEPTSRPEPPARPPAEPAPGPPKPPPAEAPPQPEPAPRRAAAPPSTPPDEPVPAPQPEPPKGEGEEATTEDRVRELEAALATAAAERQELERAFAAVIAEEADAVAQAEQAAELREEVDDLTGLLRAAEMFLSESERQRLDLARQLAAVQEENQALRGRLGLEPESGAGAPVVDAGEDAADAESDAPATGVLLPEAAVEEAAEPVAAPEADLGAEPEASPDTSELMRTVGAWAKAWSEQRVEDYLSFYAATFQPPGGSSRAEWEAQRRQRLTAPSRIEVKVTLRDVRTQSPTRVEIELLQSYSSNTYSDVVVKTLELVLESGVWKIAREASGS